MVVAKVKISGTTATTIWCKKLPAGMVGGKIQLDYADDAWAGLNKTIVFRGAVTKDVLDNGLEVNIPPETISRSGVTLSVGVYGTDTDNNLVIPTVWADLGTVQAAVTPSGDASTNPSIPVWAKLWERRPDWQASPDSDGHILNRTHWCNSEVTDTTFDGDLDGKTVVSIGDGYNFVKVSDVLVTATDLVGSTVTIYDGGEEITMEVPEDAIYDLSSDGIPAVAVAEAIICVQQDFSAYGMTFTVGVFFLCFTEDNISTAYVKHLSAIPEVQETIHRLDSKYIDAEWLANRTAEREEVLPEASQKFNSSGYSRQTFQFPLEPGQTYEVTWDGEVYAGVCNYFAYQDIMFPCVGNLSLVDESYDDTGEPFLILKFAILNLDLGTILFSQRSSSDSYHTVKVEQVGNVRKRIPFDYLPQTYTLPSDLSYIGVDESQLRDAYFHLQKGGKVNAVYQGYLHHVLAVDVDLIDGLDANLVMVGKSAVRIWDKHKGWFHYQPYKFTLCTSDYNETYRCGKKYEITVSTDGVLQTKDITGYTAE